MKPGVKTSEFWIAAILQVIGLLLETGILAPGSKWRVIAGVALQIGSALGYTASRTSLKKAAAS